MRTRILALVAVAALAPVAASATDAPHDLSATQPIDCSSCHQLHFASGSSLTNQATNFDLCNTCHAQQPGMRFAMSRTDQGQPGKQGVHHAFSSADELPPDYANVTSPAHGALPPQDVEMAKRTPGGKLQCSTCHDQHAANRTFAGTQATSRAIGSPLAGTGGGTVALATVAADATAKGYLIEILSPGGSAGAAQFRVSNDGGTSWFGCTALGTYSYVAFNDSAPNGCLTGANVGLDDGAPARVTVTFANTLPSTFASGARFRFWVSYPFLRANDAGAAMCNDCHRERVQSHVCVEGGAASDGTGAACTANGSRQFSHPVGEPPAAGRDRATPLDADGSANDSDPSNDVRLSASGTVTCLSCHAPHFADSNSLTNDTR